MSIRIIDNAVYSGTITVGGNGTFGGNVGIGTNSPDYKLDVAGEIGLDSYLRHNGDADTFFGFSGNDEIKFRTAGTDRLLIDSGGNLGIGTTSPFEKLTILGSGIGGSGDLLGLVYNSVFDRFVLATEYVANNDGNLQIKKVDGASGSPKVLMHFDNSGNVGIGTTNPTEALMVEGWIRVANNTGIKFNTSASSGDPTLNIDSSAHWNFLNTAGSNLLKIDNAGNVGIGTTSPGSRLTVSSGTTNVVANFKSTDTAAYIAIADNTSTNDLVNQIGVTGDNMWLSTADVERMRITSSGNVGIGTTSPDSLLNLEGAKNTSIITLGSTTSNSSWSVGDKYGAIDFYSGDGSGAGAGIKASISYEVEAGATGSTNSMVFRSAGTAAGTNNTERMRITASGNVGIGTASPLRKLHVVGNFAVNAAAGEYYGVNISGGEGANPNIFIGDWHNSSANLTWDSVNNFLRIDSQHSTSGAPIVFSGNDAATEYARFTTTGNLGIGTTNPGAKLHVAGGFTRFQSLGDKQIQFIGTGKNTFSIEHDTARLYFYNETATTYPLTILNGGNVGIGTTSPSAKLHIAGVNGEAVRWSGNGAAYGKLVIGTAGARLDVTGANSGYGLSFSLDDSTKMIILPSGNVGIGTTSPAAKLNIQSSASGTYLLNLDYANGTDGGGFYQSAGDGLSLYLKDSSSNTKVAITTEGDTYFNSTGNVGIGETAPTSKLEVRAETATHKLVSLNRAASPTAAMYLGNDSGNNAIISSNYSDLIFGRDQSSTLSEWMRIKRDGNVGIGTTSPGSKLQVKVGTDQNIAINSSGGVARISSYNDAVNASMPLKINGSDLRFDINSSEKMRINSAGSVGIGTTNPIVKLDINSGVARTVNTKTYSQFLHTNDIDDFQVGFATAIKGGTTSADRYVSLEAANYQKSTSVYSGGIDLALNPLGGNVGIGTTSPSKKLHITSNTTYDGIVVEGSSIPRIAITDTTNTVTLSGYSRDNDATIGTETNHPLTINTNGSERLRITNTGNVGIGTTNPNAKLHIANEGEGEFAGGNSSTAGGSHLMLKDEGSTSRTLMSGPSVVFQTPANADGTNIWATSRVLGSPAAAGSARGTISLQVRDQYDPLSDGTSWNWRTALTAINTGNVGIGTTSPGRKLEVAGDVGINGYIYHNGDDSRIGFEGNDAIRMYTANSVRLQINSNGNVGIGTTSPGASAKVTIIGNQTFGIPGNGTNTSGRFVSIEGNTDTSGEGSGRIFFAEHNRTTADMDDYGVSIGYRGGATSIVGASGNTWTGLSQIGNGEWGIFGHDNNATGVKIIQGNRTGTYTAFYSGGNETLRVTGGNVGIGTTNPNHKLHVEGRIEGDNFVLGGSDSTVFYGLYRAGVESREVRLVSYAATPSSKVQLGFNDISGSTYTFAPALTVKADLNVGIGTTNPLKPLQVDGAIAAQRSGVEGVYARRELTGSGHELDVPSGYHSLLVKNNGSEQLRITSAGNVGIGTTSPAAELHVTGQIRAYDSTNTYYANITANSTWGYFDTNATKVYISKEVRVDTGLIGSYDEALQLRTSGTTRMYINDSTGNVGIGTTSPATKLQVDGVIRSKGTSANIDVDSLYGAFRFNNGTTFTGGFYNDAVLSSGNAVDLVTYIASGDYYISTVSASKAVTVKQGGNVGIGTTSPATELDVDGEITVSDTANLNGDVIAQAMPQYASNNDAILGGLTPGTLYHNNGAVKIVI